MRRHDRSRGCRERRLVKLDLAAHALALASCIAGAIIIESIILVAAASHHVASLGFRLLSEEKEDEETRSNSADAAFLAIQIVLWTSCLLSVLSVTAMGAHGLFHAEPFDVVTMAAFAAPGIVAATTTAGLAYGLGDCHGGKADAFLSMAPTALAVGVAFSGIDDGVGRLDALAGLAAIVMLCVRTVLHLVRELD